MTIKEFTELFQKSVTQSSRTLSEEERKRMDDLTSGVTVIFKHQKPANPQKTPSQEKSQGGQEEA